MRLKLDETKTYAVVLEGGGARGAYQVGVWKALEEAGIRYNAVAGSSVGALNGAMMTMRRLKQAEEMWKNIRFSQVMNVDDDLMKKLFDLRLGEIDFRALAKGALNLLKNGGFDVTPLRELLTEVVDEQAIRDSDVEFFIATYCISDHRELYLRAKDIEPGAMQDMLLASAYYPAFRNERLGGKRYIDGGVQDVLPITPLLQSGCKDIIAIRVFGFGVERRVSIPDDVNVVTIAPAQKLGPVMNFDRELSREQFRLGYYDGLRALYGLAGRKYYIEPTLTEDQAYVCLADILRAREPELSLRTLNEKRLPELADRLKADGDYRAILCALMERAAEEADVDCWQVIRDTELLERVSAEGAWVGAAL